MPMQVRFTNAPTMQVRVVALPGNVIDVFGRQGHVVATNGDYTASQVTNVPSGSVTAVTVQAAINELATGAGVIGAALTKTDDTNVTATLGGTPTTALLRAASIALGWTGTLAASRLNSNVVQAVTNDTNITGSISTQTITLGWTSTLAVSRGGTGSGTWATNTIITGGTTGTGTFQQVASGSSGTVLTSQGAGVAPIWGPAGGAGTDAANPPQGRLTLTTGVAITTSDVTGATTLYYTPGVGSYVPITTNGIDFTNTLFTELSQAISDTTKSPYAMPANANVDIALWSDGGTLRATRGDYWSKPGTATITIATPGVVSYTGHGAQIGYPVRFTTTGALPTGITAGTIYYIITAGFTANSFQIAATVGGAAINTSGSQSGVHTAFPGNDTARGTGAGTPEVDFTTKFPTNKNAITNGPAANRGVLVGSVRSDASGQLKDTAGFRWVSNAYNAVPRHLRVNDATASWPYTLDVFRQAGGNAANQLDVLSCLTGNMANAAACGIASNSVGAVFIATGIGIDSTTISSAGFNQFQTTAGVNLINAPAAIYNGAPGLGRHTLVWLELSQATGTTTWTGTNVTYPMLSGITGSINN